ncbi:retron system putative HNH endonuclease [Magnetococcales bacterium HHB-1]
MRVIDKKGAPPEFEVWQKKQKNRENCYSQLSDMLRRSLRSALIKEQLGLCAYCGRRILLDAQDTDLRKQSHIDHMRSQRHYPSMSCDYENMVASCGSHEHCGHGKGHHSLEQLTPLMAECETEIRFSPDGQMIGRTERAKSLIMMLNLNENALCEERRGVIRGWILSEEEDILQMMKLDLSEQNEQGYLKTFAPCVINVINQMLG